MTEAVTVCDRVEREDLHAAPGCHVYVSWCIDCSKTVDGGAIVGDMGDFLATFGGFWRLLAAFGDFWRLLARPGGGAVAESNLRGALPLAPGGVESKPERRPTSQREGRGRLGEAGRGWARLPGAVASCAVSCGKLWRAEVS